MTFCRTVIKIYNNHNKQIIAISYPYFQNNKSIKSKSEKNKKKTIKKQPTIENAHKNTNKHQDMRRTAANRSRHKTITKRPICVYRIVVVR